MSIPLIAIVDYKLGNLFSVRRACEMLGHSPIITSDPRVISSASGLILPGVGAFGQAMENLRTLDLINPIVDHIAAGKKLFGICLGLQLLFEESEEFGTPKGLGILCGNVKKLPVDDAPIPQIGWNRINIALPRYSAGWNTTPLEKVNSSSWMYFIHSYYVNNIDKSDTLSETDYAGFKYTSAVLKNSIFATQFHPEKSSNEGLQIYREWIESIEP